MPTTEEIKSLVDKMPPLDVPPPAPEIPESADEKEKQDLRNRIRQQAAHFKGKLTGPAWDDAAKNVLDPILAGGKDSILAVIDLIKSPDPGPDYKPRYVLHCLGLYTARPGMEKHRKAFLDALLTHVAKPQPTPTRAYLVTTIARFGDSTANPTLAKLLTHDELADPAAQALVTLGGDAPAHLRNALPAAQGRARLAIIQSLGYLADKPSLDALARLASDEDETTRTTALWALARTGSPQAVFTLTKATPAGGEGYTHRQAVKAAFLLADTLASNGNAPAAVKLYTHLRDTHSGEKQAHLRDAADRALAALR